MQTPAYLQEMPTEHAFASFEQRRGSTPVTHLTKLLASRNTSPITTFIN